MEKYLDDILIFLGSAAILMGIYLLVGAAWTLIAGGTMSITAGVLVGLGRKVKP
jgi:hypothetical protein